MSSVRDKRSLLLGLARAVRGGDLDGITCPIEDGRPVISDWLTAVALAARFEDDPEDTEELEQS